MFFGRNEESGLRCVYHGLKFDVAGNCVDVPCIPQSSDVQRRNILAQLKIKAYPCVERGDVVWAYMGPGEHKPHFPDLEWTALPKSQRFATRDIQECNWLQGLEGGHARQGLAGGVVLQGLQEKAPDLDDRGIAGERMLGAAVPPALAPPTPSRDAEMPRCRDAGL